MATGELTSTMEHYLEAIFELEEIGERVTQARLARWFGVSAPATSEVVHRMEDMGLIDLLDDRTIILADAGRGRAQEMAKRHRVIERYLVDVLRVPWHLADEETRKIEPGVSEVVEAQMQETLGDVDRCPHGNPIPGTPAAVPVELTPLNECEGGRRVRIDRIREDLELDLEMLRYLEEQDLLPGRILTVSGHDPEGNVTVELEDQPVGVGRALASHVLCVPA